MARTGEPVSWAALVVPALVAFFGALGLARSPLARRLIDRPNERSLHTEATPRVGGIALLLGALSIAAWGSDPTIRGLLVFAVALAVVSAMDDARPLPVLVRLGAHALAAVGAVLYLGSPADGAYSVFTLLVFAVPAIAWMTNLFNFMDGSDGLAGCMGAVGFGTLGLVALTANEPALGFASLAIASANIGFLGVNWPPARVFMGDAGAIPLGFLAGVLGVLGFVRHVWPAWFPVMVFAPFVFDATFTLLRRLARRERIWIAHRQHAYQKLVLTGWNKRKLATWALVAMICNAAAACAALRQSGSERYVIISVLAVAWLLLLAAIERRRA